MRTTVTRGLRDSRKTLALPSRDLLLIALTRFPARLLRRPVQSVVQHSPDMIVVKRHAKMLVNQCGHTGARPQFRCPTVGFRSFQKKFFQTFELHGGQAGGRTVMRFGRQAVRFLRQSEPAVDTWNDSRRTLVQLLQGFRLPTTASVAHIRRLSSSAAVPNGLLMQL